MVKSLDRMGLQQVTRLREPVGRLTTLLIVAQSVRDHVFREDTSMRADLPEGERAILETTFRYPGDFMFHAHQSEFAELGWMGLFRAEGARRET